MLPTTDRENAAENVLDIERRGGRLGGSEQDVPLLLLLGGQPFQFICLQRLGREAGQRLQAEQVRRR